ncbi:MAG TPA: transposase [Cyanobacteria bacterium UBA8803]|nr:transposase [Cyanobacteria bacterium UBA9273]HBL57815.1 transposase [Cyanobacteria bacterium UBA8803]
MPIRRVTFRLYPNKKQAQTLRYHRKLHKELYNAAVYNRFTQYQKFGHKVDYFEQQNCLPAFKEVWMEYKECNCMTLQATLKRVDYAFQRWLKGLGKRPRYKSIRHYSGWTYPSKTGWKAHTSGDNGYLELAQIGSIQMRGKARVWGKPTTCTIVYRNGKWLASITVEVEEIKRATDIGAVGIDLGCKSALAVTDGENHDFVEAPRFLRKAEAKIKKLSKAKRRKTAPNRRKKQKASSRWKKAQAKISKITRKIASQRQNWVHQVASDIVRRNSFVATEKLEVAKMTARAKKGKRKKQKAGLNKSILDVGLGMLRSAIQSKITEAGGVFIEVPTKKVKPSQTCPKCGHQRKKSLDERVHQCQVCGLTMDRDLAAALVMLLWGQGKLPGFETNLVDADVSSSTSDTSKRKFAGSQKQLGQKKRQKSALTGLDAKTSPSTK